MSDRQPECQSCQYADLNLVIQLHLNDKPIEENKEKN